jgi:AbrB family looped-hinge helix DNA binding protein
MQTVITSKYQTTIPKAIRESLSLCIKDSLEWKIENGKIVLYPVKMVFLNHRNTIKTGKGDIAADIETARNIHIAKYR